jgi:hypothetical protein
MEQRAFSEVELRTMLDDSSEITRARRPGRWIVWTRHQGESWAVVVEPDEEARILIVVTAYPINELS